MEIFEGQIQKGEERGAGEGQEWCRGGSQEEMEIPPHSVIPRAIQPGQGDHLQLR